MSIMIPSCNAHAYMKFSKKNFAPYAKNATVKNIITINKYNVGMKSLDRAIIVSDTLKTETSPSFISQVRAPVPVPVPVPFPFPAPVPDSGFRLFDTPYRDDLINVCSSNLYMSYSVDWLGSCGIVPDISQNYTLFTIRASFLLPKFRRQ